MPDNRESDMIALEHSLENEHHTMLQHASTYLEAALRHQQALWDDPEMARVLLLSRQSTELLNTRAKMILIARDLVGEPRDLKNVNSEYINGQAQLIANYTLLYNEMSDDAAEEIRRLIVTR